MGLPSPPERRSIASLGGQFVWTIWDRREWILTFRATRTGYSVDVYVAEHATLDLELPAISLSGTVRTDRTDRPVAGGWVRLARVDASADSLPVVLGAPIASDGSFRFEGLPRASTLSASPIGTSGTSPGVCILPDARRSSFAWSQTTAEETAGSE